MRSCFLPTFSASPPPPWALFAAKAEPLICCRGEAQTLSPSWDPSPTPHGCPSAPTSGFIPPPSPSLRYATFFPSHLQPHLFHGCPSPSFPCQAPSPNPLHSHAQPPSRMWVSPSDLAGLPFPILTRKPIWTTGTSHFGNGDHPAGCNQEDFGHHPLSAFPPRLSSGSAHPGGGRKGNAFPLLGGK